MQLLLRNNGAQKISLSCIEGLIAKIKGYSSDE
jgi:hypothetical protein